MALDKGFDKWSLSDRQKQLIHRPDRWPEFPEIPEILKFVLNVQCCPEILIDVLNFFFKLETHEKSDKD